MRFWQASYERKAIARTLVFVFLALLIVGGAVAAFFALRTPLQGGGTTTTAKGCSSAPFNSTLAEIPFAVSFSRPAGARNWGINVEGVHYASNQTSIALNCPSSIASYYYDASFSAPNGSRYLCKVNCSGTVLLSSSVSRLHVEGNKVKDESGDVLVLRGVDIQEYGYGTSYPMRYSEFHFKYLAQQWQAKIVRIPVAPSYWRGVHPGIPGSNSSYYLAKVLDPMVKLANKYGMYAIIDWHIEGNVNTPGIGTNTGTSLTSFSETMNFWSTISQHFNGRIGVLYEIMNEPANMTLSTWRTTSQQIVDGIRRYDNNTLILIGGLNWSSDLSGVLQGPVNGKNLAYVDHPYPVTASTFQPSCQTSPIPCWDRTFGKVANIYPVFATEWGFYATDEDPACNQSYARYWNGYEAQLTSYLQAKRISWSPWSWAPVPGNGSCFSMFKAGNIYELTQLGLFVRNQLTTLAPPATYSPS